MNSLAAWLNASQRSRVGVGMNRSARGEALSGPTDWILLCIKSYLLPLSRKQSLVNVIFVAKKVSKRAFPVLDLNSQA